MTDYSKFSNPFDFANPVSDSALFIGREKEMEEIKYYLDQASKAPRPINIAIIGPRASGKTSLLNMCEIEATKREFCTVRVDLDEDDVKTQMGFFFKIFDGIFSSVCETGAYGGKEGKTYDTYLDIVNTYTIPDEKTFCPLLFPLQYARVMGSEKYSAPLSDHNFKKDLVKIRSEVNRPIIVLFDEGNILTKSRVHLEKLRNIFMNIPGYMLVITGTTELFPLIDEIFSPIVRQFKRIIVGGFKDNKETEECIKKPLKTIGIEPSDIFDFKTFKDVMEIHDLSGGRPYEIQLICHKLFQRVQTKRAKKMKLDLNILEDVRKELEISQSIIARPILIKIRNLTKSQLYALGTLCHCDGKASFDQIWAIEYILNDERAWKKDILSKELQFFINENIIEIKEGMLKFCGDDFDKIYTKYFSREQRVPLIFSESPPIVFWQTKLTSLLERFKGLEGFPGYVTSRSDFSFDNIISKMKHITTDQDMLDGDVLVEEPFMLVLDLYFLMLDYSDSKSIPIIRIHLDLPWLTVQSFFYLKDPKDTDSFKSCLSIFQDSRKRANEVGGDLIAEFEEIEVVPMEVLAQMVEHSDNEVLRKLIADRHANQMAVEYIENYNVERALLHANLACRYYQDIEGFGCNNIGYLFMAQGDLDKAKTLLERAVFCYEGSPGLPNYNLGILEAKAGNLNNALEKINLCIKQSDVLPKAMRICGCLIVPKIVDKKLNFNEIRDADLLEVAIEAKNNIESLLNN